MVITDHRKLWTDLEPLCPSEYSPGTRVTHGADGPTAWPGTHLDTHNKVHPNPHLLSFSHIRGTSPERSLLGPRVGSVVPFHRGETKARGAASRPLLSCTSPRPSSLPPATSGPSQQTPRERGGSQEETREGSCGLIAFGPVA